jgi:DnaJ-class molecular chaperone
MGLRDRFVELARERLNGLLDRAAQVELEQQREDRLEAELQRRRSAVNAQEMERDRRLAMEAAARARGQKRKVAPRTSAAEAARNAYQLRALYQTLGVPMGSSLDDCKHAYRALMREHHPDRHARDPRGQQRASDRAAQISAAYAELEKLLG